jgi:hypothetical protein
VLNVGASGEAWRGGWIGPCTIPGSGPCISFALLPAASRVQAPQLWRRDAIFLDLHLPTDRPGLVLCCRIDTRSEDLSRLRRDVHRAGNHRSSAWAIAGMVLLLAICGWIVEGAEGARRVMTGAIPRPGDGAVSRDIVYRWFGAHLLSPAEIAGILAHEVAHIRNNDAWAMGWVTALHRAIEWTSSAGLARLRAQNGGMAASLPLAILLSAAPAIGQLLGLSLCRIRELDADATALDLTGDVRGLIAALDKLERHHTGCPVAPFAAVEDGSMHLLRSHPATSERVGTLLSLAY